MMSWSSIPECHSENQTNVRTNPVCVCVCMCGAIIGKQSTTGCCDEASEYDESCGKCKEVSCNALSFSWDIKT